METGFDPGPLRKSPEKTSLFKVSEPMYISSLPSNFLPVVVILQTSGFETLKSDLRTMSFSMPHQLSTRMASAGRREGFHPEKGRLRDLWSKESNSTCSRQRTITRALHTFIFQHRPCESPKSMMVLDLPNLIYLFARAASQLVGAELNSLLFHLRKMRCW